MFTILTIDGKDYNLRLTTKTSIALEKALGANPIEILFDMEAGKMPQLSTCVTMLHGMLQAQHHGMSFDKTIDLFDKYVDEGHSMFDLIPVFVEVFQNSGYMGKGEAEETEDEKN